MLGGEGGGRWQRGLREGQAAAARAGHAVQGRGRVRQMQRGEILKQMPVGAGLLRVGDELHVVERRGFGRAGRTEHRHVELGVEKQLQHAFLCPQQTHTAVTGTGFCGVSLVSL